MPSGPRGETTMLDLSHRLGILLLGLLLNPELAIVAAVGILLWLHS